MLSLSPEPAWSVGYTTDFAITGTEGLDKVNKSKPAAVLHDLILPDVDGLEVLAQIRECPECSSLPVIIVSGK